MKSMRPRRGGGAYSGDAPKTRVYLIGANDMVRSEVTLLAESLPDANWTSFDTAREFLHGAAVLAQGVALVVHPSAASDALQVVDWLAHHKPEIPSIVLSSDPSLEAAVASLKAGAADFLVLPIEAAALAQALKSAVEPPRERPSRQTAMRRQWIASRLSQRELEVLNELVAGLSNKAIGAKLGISERTVEVHRSRIMRRLEVDSFAMLVRLAVEAGFESP